MDKERLSLLFCDSCKERHYGGNCPPHEVRTTGVAWFRERITDLEGELELAKAKTQRFSDSANASEKQLVGIAAFLGGDARDVKIGEKTITGLVKQEVEQSRQELSNLLTIIHRDGGHHTREVGERQSIKDAHRIWADRGVEIGRLRRFLTEHVLELKSLGHGDQYYLRQIGLRAERLLKGSKDESS